MCRARSCAPARRGCDRGRGRRRGGGGCPAGARGRRPRAFVAGWRGGAKRSSPSAISRTAARSCSSSTAARSRFLPPASRRSSCARGRAAVAGRSRGRAGLQKSYGAHAAVRGIDFEIGAGEVFGLLGPNGAGKTTTIEILEGYRDRDARRRRGARRDPQRAGRAWRERLGIVLQSSALYPNLTVRESLRVFGGYYGSAARRRRGGRDRRARRRRPTRACRTLSGGQKRRLDLGLALIGNPELIFLDEPTTGFDPGARRAAWETIRNLRSLGTTILLTTHYLDEAEQLADRVAVLRDGEIVRDGSPSELTGGAVETEIRYLRDGETVVERTTRADPATARADGGGARARRRARGARGPPADARRRLPRADRMRLVAARAPHRAAALLAQPRGGDLHVLPAGGLLPDLRRRLRRQRDRERGHPRRARSSRPG